MNIRPYEARDLAAVVALMRQTLALPGIGSVGGFGGRREDTETFYTFTNFTTPGAIYRLDMATRASTQRFKQEGARQGSQIGHALVESPTRLIVDEAVKATRPCANRLKR